MAWIILEGLDRTGKSTVAKAYEKKGYVQHHMSAPDKKYSTEGYTGPSYLDEMMELYMELDGKDVIFDRSPYGELVWPTVYGRTSLLTTEDLDVLKEYETANEVQKFLMIDPNRQAHWQRCVDNKEDMNKHQFHQAGILFNKIAHQHNFIPRQLDDWKDLIGKAEEEPDDSKPEDSVDSTEEISQTEPKDDKSALAASAGSKVEKSHAEIYDPVVRLERANAINKVLSSKIIRIKGSMFEDIESDVRNFLKSRLSTLLGEETEDNFSNEEVEILKVFVNTLKNRQKEQK